MLLPPPLLQEPGTPAGSGCAAVLFESSYSSTVQQSPTLEYYYTGVVSLVLCCTCTCYSIKKMRMSGNGTTVHGWLRVTQMYRGLSAVECRAVHAQRLYMPMVLPVPQILCLDLPSGTWQMQSENLCIVH